VEHLIVLLIAHGSSMGFNTWMPTHIPTIDELLAEKSAYIDAHVKLSNDKKPYRNCFDNWPKGQLFCELHELSTLGHTVEIQNLARQQKPLSRQIDRLNRGVLHLMKQRMEEEKKRRQQSH
jgi:hypothetical protein